MGNIKKIHKMLNQKKISCTELVQKYLDAIASFDNTINAYITVTPDEAFRVAKIVDKKIACGERISLLEGIPMTLKDNILTKGILTTCASRMLSEYIPVYDATVYKLLKAENAVLLGKTNMDEFAMGSSCRTSYYGGSKNPFDITKVPGGSSGGGAAAVAANLAVYAIGSDTGGSIREPAAFCGVVGLKPTYGSISRYGIIAYASSLDQAGPMAQTVEDVAIVYDTLAVKDPKDATSRGNFHGKALIQLNNNIAGLTLGVVDDYLECASEDVQYSFQEAVKVYESLGVKVIHVQMPCSQDSLKAYYVQSCVEVASNLARYDGVREGLRLDIDEYVSVQDMMEKVRTAGFGDEVKRRIIFGTYVSKGEYYDKYHLSARNAVKSILREFDEAFNKCDILISPTAMTTAFSDDFKFTNPVDGYKADMCTVPVNMLGLCAVSVPCGIGKDGLPIGLQVIGNKFCEAQILNVAYRFEKEYSIKLPDMGVQL